MERKQFLMVTGVALAMLSAQGAPLAQTTSAAPAPAPAMPMEATALAEQPAFSQEQIEQMVAPIALYPDALLVQVLMSSTYPLEIVQVTRWVKKNPNLKGEALDSALLEQSWDPSVKTMVMFPTVLERMNDNLDWTQDLGDAFLAQEQDVMDAVQRLRKEAQQTGALRDTPQQKVIVEKETVVVQPADPQTIYVPTYDPSQVYGAPAPSTVYYPAVYRQPVHTSTSSSDQWVSFGVGALVGAMLTAAILWDRHDHHHHHVYHYGPGYWGGGWKGPRYGSGRWKSYRNTNIYIGGDVNIGNKYWKRQGSLWEHSVEHRRGVNYKDREKVVARHPEVARPIQPVGIDRDTARGKQLPITLPAKAERRPAAGMGELERAGATTRPAERPKAGAGERERPAADSGPAKRPETSEAQPAQRARVQARPQQAIKTPRPTVSPAPKTTKGSAVQADGSSSGSGRQASQRGQSSRRGATQSGVGSGSGGGDGVRE